MTIEEFHNVICNTIEKLKIEAATNPELIASLNTGVKFQNHVWSIVSAEVKILDEMAEIENKENRSFPDIIIKCSDGTKYGIEIKSSSDNTSGWETPGNSINESSLVPDLLEIQIIFGKTHPSRQDFRYGLYSDFVKAIKTTHYPRFIIDMAIPSNQSIFTQMGISFDNFNRLSDSDRLQAIKDFYISKGEYYWWLTDDAGNAIRIFENLDSHTINSALAYGFVHFPKVVSKSSKKYEKLAKYIASEYGAVSTSLRDRVSAGGRADLTTRRKTYLRVPRVYINMYNMRKEIQQCLASSKLRSLREDWLYRPTARTKKAAWVEVMNVNAADSLSVADRKMILEDIINTP